MTSPAAVIDAYESFLRIVSPRAIENPAYAASKVMWPGYLAYLEPAITRRYFPPGTATHAANRHQHELTSVSAGTPAERALYFGLLSFCSFCSNKVRDRYRSVDSTELYNLWSTASVTMESSYDTLENYGFFKVANPKFIDAFATQFFAKEVRPLIEDPRKTNAAIAYFSELFLAGLLLGQIADALILKQFYAGR